jgi:hypothetical protein
VNWTDCGVVGVDLDEGRVLVEWVRAGDGGGAGKEGYYILTSPQSEVLRELSI